MRIENHIIKTRFCKCKCGCGETFQCEARSKKRYIVGHWKRSREISYYKSENCAIETRFCAGGCGKTFECEKRSKQRFIMGHQNRGKLNGMHGKRGKDNPNYNPENHIMETRVCDCPDHEEFQCEKRSKQRFINGHSGKGKQCLRKVKIGKFMTKLWKDSEYARKTLKAQHKHPNKAESKLNTILQSIVPGEFALNVRGEIMILGGKVPDFININGQKKLIEMNGDYWHGKKRTGRTRKQEELQRINYFKKYGWSTLIVWENELKSKEKLKQKILEFNRRSL